MIEDVLELFWPYARDQLQLTRADLVDCVLWHYEKGYMTLCIEDGKPVGAALWWRLKDLKELDDDSDWPSHEEGDYLYCAYGVGKIGMLESMIKGARERFPGVKYFCFQRGHRGDERTRVWRLKDE